MSLKYKMRRDKMFNDYILLLRARAPSRVNYKSRLLHQILTHQYNFQILDGVTFIHIHRHRQTSNIELILNQSNKGKNGNMNI